MFSFPSIPCKKCFRPALRFSAVSSIMEGMAKNILQLVMPIIIALAAAGAIVFGVWVLKNNITFDLNGEKNMDIRVGSTYEEPGCVAIVFDRALTDAVVVKGEVNTAVTGKYRIRYHLTHFWGYPFFLTRTVNVIDDTPPAMELEGDDELLLRVGEPYEERGAVSFDNYDGDITEKIVIADNVDTSKEGRYHVKYSVRDSSGNEARASRAVVVQRDEGIQAYITDYIKTHGYEVSVGYYNLVTGDEYLYRPDQLYYGASLIKTLDADYLYDKNMADDELKLYLYNAVYKSSNEAHEYLVDHIGKDRLRIYGMQLGAEYTLSTTDDYGDTTVRDQMVYWKKLYEFAKDDEQLRSFFINSYGNFLKIDGVTVMHKYGYNGEFYHDAGIVLDERPYIIIVLTKHGNDDYGKVIADISELIYNYHGMY